MHQLPFFVVSLVCLTEPPKYAGSNVSGGLCFDVRFPAGGVTDCRSRGGKCRGVDMIPSESRCCLHTERLMFLWLQVVSCDRVHKLDGAVVDFIFLHVRVCLFFNSRSFYFVFTFLLI